MIAISVAFAISLLYSGSQSDAMGPYSLQNILTATNGRATGFAGDTTFAGVGTDSRTIQPNELFWALPGPNHDGHAFLHEAMRAGAAGAVVREESRVQPAIVVPDTLRALHDFAGWHRRQHDPLVIGVTGSFGKTTTREMIYAALNAKHTGIRSPHNFNNHIGVPLTLLELNETHDFAVVELAASAPNEIAALANIAGPEIGVVTGIGLAHLDGFGNEDNIVRAKSELLQALPESGFTVLAADNPVVREMAKAANCPVLFVGEREDNHLTATDVRVASNSVTFTVDKYNYHIAATGRHHVHAGLIAIAIGREIGLSPSELADGLDRFQPVYGRCLTRQIGPWTVIDDTYNANPASMRAACEILQDWPEPGKRILVAGDMLELNGESNRLHRDFGTLVAKTDIEHLLSVGECSTTVTAAALQTGMHPSQIAACDAESLDTALTVLDCWLEPGDVVLVKGSRGLRMERVIQWLEQHANTTLQETIFRTSVRACA